MPPLPLKTVLVVEDDFDIRDAIVDTLRSADFEAVPLNDGMDALYYLRNNPNPSAIVLDLLMPRMDGISVLEHLHRVQPHLVRNTIVASASPDLIRACDPFPIAGTMKKPFNGDALVALLKRVCGG